MDRPGLARLLTDAPLLAIASIYLVIGLLSPVLPGGLAGYLGAPLLVVLVIAAVQYRLRGAESASGRMFWHYVSAALALWLAAFTLERILPHLRERPTGTLFLDFLYASYFLALVFATEIRPDFTSAVQPREREEELHLGSTVSFLLALVIYCGVIPSQRDAESYLTGYYSVLLYLCLDLFFLARFAYLAGSARGARWRLVYLSLLLSFGLSAAFSLRALAAPGSAAELSATWGFLPFIPILVAARASRHIRQAPAAAAGEPYASRVWEPLAFHAIAFPLLHLLLDFYGKLSSPSRAIQQGLVIVYFIFFGFLSLVHSAWQEKKRRAAENALRDSEHRYRQLIESHPDAILIEQDGALAYANSAGVELLGVDAAGERRSLADLGFPEGRGDPIPVEGRVAAAAGHEIDLEVSYFEISYLGRPAIQAIARDVTAVKRQRAESERLARLASLGQFSAAMAHKIRNPLAAIVMQTFFLRDRVSGDREITRSLADINAAAERMQKLVEGILGFVRPATSHFADEDLIAVADSARRDLARHDLARISFVEDYRHRNAVVAADVNQLVGALAHIFDNAARAMPDGGAVTLATDNPTDESVRLVIEDDGGGIREEDRERIFEPFFTRRGDGVGLGLALVARVLEAHSCDYRVESRPGEGTRFILNFQLAQPLATAAGEPAPAA